MKGGEVELREKLGRNDPCPCGSGKRFQAALPERGRAAGLLAVTYGQAQKAFYNGKSGASVQIASPASMHRSEFDALLSFCWLSQRAYINNELSAIVTAVPINQISALMLRGVQCGTDGILHTYRRGVNQPGLGAIFTKLYSRLFKDEGRDSDFLYRFARALRLRSIYGLNDMEDTVLKQQISAQTLRQFLIWNNAMRIDTFAFSRENFFSTKR
ncbi:SEC-C domain-containing protein [Erythrobacter sp. A30-3]|nr:SEC-C domain-containing protein [Erythrobacter sp. A30-3]